jgi:hypothetical protein
MTWADERGERLPLWCDKVLLSSSIGSDQNLHFWIVLERLLHVRSVFVLCRHESRQSLPFVREGSKHVVRDNSGVTVFGKDNQLLAR